MLLQLKWKYVQSTIPSGNTLILLIKGALRENFFPTIFGGDKAIPDSGKSWAIELSMAAYIYWSTSCRKIMHTEPPRQAVGNW